MSTFTKAPLTLDQTVNNLEVEDDLTCNSGSFTALSATTSNIINATTTSLISSNLTVTTGITGSSGYFTNLLVPNVTISTSATGSKAFFNNLILSNNTGAGTAIIGNLHMDSINNKLWFYGASGWVSSTFS